MLLFEQKMIKWLPVIDNGNNMIQSSSRRSQLIVTNGMSITCKHGGTKKSLEMFYDRIKSTKMS